MVFHLSIPKDPRTEHTPFNAFPAVGAKFSIGGSNIFRADYQVLPIKKLHNLQIMATTEQQLQSAKT
jgi:hypothetical protein